MIVTEKKRAAYISDDERYRYWLTRTWGTGPTLGVIMLNPSRADMHVDDPTIRRVESFAARDGFGASLVTNLYALRSHDPRELARAVDPVGPENDATLEMCLRNLGTVLCAWGAHPAAAARVDTVRRLIAETGAKPVCLATNRDGSPKHPLYVSHKAQMLPWH